MASFPDNRRFGVTDIRVVTDAHNDIFKTLDMYSPSTSGESKDMEINAVGNSPITPLTDTSFSPPTGHWDIGDIVRYGDKKWMMLGSDNEWHEHEGADEYSSEYPGSEKVKFFREQEDWSGYGEKMVVSTNWYAYRRWEESALDATFEKYKLDGKDEAKLRKLIKSMMKGKVKPTNVACFALGSLHSSVNEPKRSLQQFAVLLKFMEILDISPNARNLMQDPEFCPRDARFFAKYGFETVLDPEGFDSINEETLVVHIGGYDFIDRRAVESHWPAAHINMGFPFFTRGHILQNKSKFEKKIWKWLFGTRRDSFKSLFRKEDVKAWWEYRMERALMTRSYSWRDIPEVGICDGMAMTQFFWRRAVVGERCDFVEAAGVIANASLHLFTDVVPMAKLLHDRSKRSNRDDDDD
ncbi:hypothetical protein EAE99_011217 [Botrytis elliptica]|nr:hypothetical protein EAE99_011217 [Botrytis elliptica]